MHTCWIKLRSNNVVRMTGPSLPIASTKSGALITVIKSESVQAASQVQCLASELLSTEDGTTQLSTMQVPTLLYRPDKQSYRVVWYGGESTQLHFEKLWNTWDPDTNETWQEWLDRDVRTLGAMPTSMKDMLMEMQEYYQYSLDMEQERIREMM